MALDYALGESPGDPDVAWGTEMVRYWQELFRSPDGETYHVDPAEPGPWRRRQRESERVADGGAVDDGGPADDGAVDDETSTDDRVGGDQP